MTKSFYFFTGAGISAESGIPTFRGNDGIWRRSSIERVCNFTNLFNNYDTMIDDVCQFYDARLNASIQARPNPAHEAIADLARHHPVRVMTSNIDLLHEQTGIVPHHLHGSVTEINCMQCGHRWKREGSFQDHARERCPSCGCKKSKPGVTFFGENIHHQEHVHAFYDSVKIGDVFITVGVNHGIVTDPFRMLRHKHGTSAFRMFDLHDFNIEDINHHNSAFVNVHLGPAGVNLPKFLDTFSETNK